jgi:hypothetical protein
MCMTVCLVAAWFCVQRLEEILCDASREDVVLQRMREYRRHLRKVGSLCAVQKRGRMGGGD